MDAGLLPLMRDFTSLPEFDLMFMFAVKSYLHSWCFQCPFRSISNCLTVFACITDSGRLFHISTILTTKVYFLTFSLHAQFMEITCIFSHNLVMFNILFSIETILWMCTRFKYQQLIRKVCSHLLSFSLF